MPFWTFFGATLLGKAVIKMHIQKIFVIVAFNETLLAKAVSLLGTVPIVGLRLQEPFSAFLVKQKERLHRKGDGDSSGSVSSLHHLGSVYYYSSYTFGIKDLFILQFCSTGRKYFVSNF